VLFVADSLVEIFRSLARVFENSLCSLFSLEAGGLRARRAFAAGLFDVAGSGLTPVTRSGAVAEGMGLVLA